MINKNKILVVGAGGHAKVILATLGALKQKVLGLVDDNPKLLHHDILGCRVLGNLSYLKEWTGKAICAFGDNHLRFRIVSAFQHIEWIHLIHPQAYVHPSVALGNGSVVFAGAIIQPDVNIGDHVIVNTATSIDHDCRLAHFSHIAPGTHLGGGVKIGEGSLLGIGTSVKPYLEIGKWSVIGAGSVIVNPIADRVFAKGVPAKVYKPNSD